MYLLIGLHRNGFSSLFQLFIMTENASYYLFSLFSYLLTEQLDV